MSKSSILTAKPKGIVNTNPGSQAITQATINLYERSLRLSVKTISVGGASVESEVFVRDIDRFDVAGFSGFGVLPEGEGITLGGKSFPIEDVCAVAGVEVPNLDHVFADTPSTLAKKEQMKKMLEADPSWHLNEEPPPLKVKSQSVAGPMPEIARSPLKGGPFTWIHFWISINFLSLIGLLALIFCGYSSNTIDVAAWAFVGSIVISFFVWWTSRAKNTQV
jgi:hypothetical protein